ncbi:hypothetical protein [Nonomuraea sp. SYSU D8015]|uniref:hypothetical protein n=1 Tax=Nonomuraea sp. SYSU D8015 TaxID=2593644 RepID=UPI0016604EB0|nr:hypothetical protein [Nonomuraea sp. SYSU D8015]
MLKRRLAIVGTAAVLGLAGLAGPALADGGLVDVHGDPDGTVTMRTEPVFVGGKLTCWVSGGKVVKFSRTKVAELVEDRVIDPERAWDVADDGVTVVPADRVTIAVAAQELPRKVVGKRWRHGRVVHLTCVWDEFAAK